MKTADFFAIKALVREAGVDVAVALWGEKKVKKVLR